MRCAQIGGAWLAWPVAHMRLQKYLTVPSKRVRNGVTNIGHVVAHVAAGRTQGGVERTTSAATEIGRLGMERYRSIVARGLLD